VTEPAAGWLRAKVTISAPPANAKQRSEKRLVRPTKQRSWTAIKIEKILGFSVRYSDGFAMDFD
jgi:hypothetical protein